MSNPVAIDADYLINLLKEMIRIDSVLPNEERLTQIIANEIRAMGIKPELHEAVPGRSNVYASADLGKDNRFLVFSGHSDTVPPAPDWETNPFTPTVQDGRLYGLGASSMKAGLACMIAAFKALLKAKGHIGRLGLAVTVDQEGLSLGAKALLKSRYGECDAMLHAEHFHGDSETDYLPEAVTGKVLYKFKGKGPHRTCLPSP